MVDAAPGALPSRREGSAAFRPTTGGVVYGARLPARPVTAGSVASGATSMTRRLGRRRRGWNKSSLVPRGDEAQRRSHPGLVDGGRQLKIVKHAPARRTSVTASFRPRPRRGRLAAYDPEAAGSGSARRGMRALLMAVSILKACLCTRPRPSPVTVPDDCPRVPRA